MVAKKLVFLSLICLLLIYPAKSVFAEAEHCESVTVVKAGVNPGGYMVQLKNTNTSSACGDWELNTLRSFYLHKKYANALLATALTAKSTNATVFVQTRKNTYNDWNSIHTLYINDK